jgi:micrococcal nuclease
MASFIKKVPGFRSGVWWKGLIALGGYFFIFLTILAFLVPTTPTLALDELGPTNKNSSFISGKTSANKSVYLLQGSGVVQEVKSDSRGSFSFALNDLKDGNYSYTVEVCNSEKRKKCESENTSFVVDTTPPGKPVLAMPSSLPDNSEGEITIRGSVEPNSKVIALLPNDEVKELQANGAGKFELKTGLVLGANTINFKAVDSLGNEGESETVSLDFNPTKYKVKVLRVIDGDTIKIEGDQVVRYIGIDSPETVHPSKPVQCYGKEASSKNRELIEGKEVMLEKDVSETDKYGRLLRYVWLGDMLVNEYLVREGYAKSSSYPPDIKYQDKFNEAEKLAREEEKGLWGGACNPTPTPVPVIQRSQTTTSPTNQTQPPSSKTNTETPSTQTQQTQPAAGSYTCDCSKTCPNMSSCEEAQYQLNVCGCTRRDGDKDGIACDADCQ